MSSRIAVCGQPAGAHRADPVVGQHGVAAGTPRPPRYRCRCHHHHGQLVAQLRAQRRDQGGLRAEPAADADPVPGAGRRAVARSCFAWSRCKESHLRGGAVRPDLRQRVASAGSRSGFGGHRESAAAWPPKTPVGDRARRACAAATRSGSARAAGGGGRRSPAAGAPTARRPARGGSGGRRRGTNTRGWCAGPARPTRAAGERRRPAARSAARRPLRRTLAQRRHRVRTSTAAPSSSSPWSGKWSHRTTYTHEGTSDGVAATHGSAVKEAVTRRRADPGVPGTERGPRRWPATPVDQPPPRGILPCPPATATASRRAHNPACSPRPSTTAHIVAARTQVGRCVRRRGGMSPGRRRARSSIVSRVPARNVPGVDRVRHVPPGALSPCPVAKPLGRSRTLVRYAERGWSRRLV